MFTIDAVEKDSAEVVLKDIKSAGLKAVIDSCYSGWIQITDENLDDILATASHLRFEQVEEACEQFLLSQLNSATCLGIHAVAQRFNLSKMSIAAMGLIADHFADIIATDEFLLLSFEQLTEVLKSDDLDVESESAVVTAMMSWVEHDKVARVKKLPQLLSLIRFEWVDKEVNLSAP